MKHRCRCGTKRNVTVRPGTEKAPLLVTCTPCGRRLMPTNALRAFYSELRAAGGVSPA